MYRSRRKMTKRLASKAIRYAMNQLAKGKRVSVVIPEPEVTPRYIRRLRAEFRETGSVYVPRFPGRLGVYDADPQPKDMKTMKYCLPHGLFINWTNHPRVYIAKS